MPYEITVTKQVTVAESDHYINQCCWGGDLVRDELLPLFSERYEDVRTGQEDWGWFIWFVRGEIRLAVDVFCDDPKSGTFRIMVTSRRKRFLRPGKVDDTPELEVIRQIVVEKLERWAESVVVEKVSIP